MTTNPVDDLTRPGRTPSVFELDRTARDIAGHHAPAVAATYVRALNDHSDAWGIDAVTYNTQLATLLRAEPTRSEALGEALNSPLFDPVLHHDVLRRSMIDGPTEPIAELAQRILATRPTATPTLFSVAACKQLDSGQWELLVELVGDNMRAELRHQVIIHPAATAEKLNDWFQSASPAVRRSVVSNPNCPLPILLEAANKPHFSWIRQFAAQHPRVAAYYGYGGPGDAPLWARTLSSRHTAAQHAARFPSYGY